MLKTADLRLRHDATEALIDQIFADIGDCRSDEDAVPLVRKLARLDGMLRTQFELEDHGLYPSMIESDHREAALMARVYRDELDHLALRFVRFFERWSSSAAIAGARRQFRFEAGMLFAALRDRIHRENRDLFPLAEEAGARKAAVAMARATTGAHAPLTA